MDHELRVKISKVCAELNVDGLRGDIVTNRAAKAFAALKGRDQVTTEDIAIVIPNYLRHMLRILWSRSIQVYLLSRNSPRFLVERSKCGSCLCFRCASLHAS
ncbi:putative magnesium chelatase [Helianthus anomalus]